MDNPLIRMVVVRASGPWGLAASSVARDLYRNLLTIDKNRSCKRYCFVASEATVISAESFCNANELKIMTS
jgi:hypothetical protein